MNIQPSSNWRHAVNLGLVAALLLSAAFAQETAQPQSPELQRVLKQMDQTAANFKTTQAAFVWDQYQKVVDEHDLQKGMVYFRRSGDEVQMAADISDPVPPKY